MSFNFNQSTCGVVSKGVLLDCANLQKRHIIDMVMINLGDIDKATSTATNCLVSSLKLIDGKVGYPIVGIKQNNFFSVEANILENDLNEFTQTISFNIDPNDCDTINNLKDASIAIVARMSDGTFQVLGWENGLEIATSPYSVAENKLVTITMAASESSWIKAYLDTDATTSLQNYQALFSSTPIPTLQAGIGSDAGTSVTLNFSGQVALAASTIASDFVLKTSGDVSVNVTAVSGTGSTITLTTAALSTANSPYKLSYPAGVVVDSLGRSLAGQTNYSITVS